MKILRSKLFHLVFVHVLVFLQGCNQKRAVESLGELKKWHRVTALFGGSEKQLTTSVDQGKMGKTLKIKWFNPRTSGLLQAGTRELFKANGIVGIGYPPPQHEKNWLTLLTHIKTDSFKYYAFIQK